MSSTTQLGGLGTLILLLIGLVCSCCYCYMKCRRRQSQSQPPDDRRSHAMVYSVTMQGGTGDPFYDSVTEYLRNSQINDTDSEAGIRQRQLNENFLDEKYLTPKGLPSYDDVISGKFEGTEPPPPYSETTNSNSDASTSYPQSSS